MLDEPTVGLDPVLRVQLWKLFAQLATEGTTLLISSHVMDEATRCDWLVLMREGRIIAQETPDSLLERTGTTTAEDAFLSLIAEKHEPGPPAPIQLRANPPKHRSSAEEP